MAKNDNNVKFNINKFITGSEEETNHYLAKEITPVEDTKENKPHRGRPKKESTEVVPAPESYPAPQSSMSYIQQNIPYTSAYAETNEQLDETIQQLNMLGNNLMGEMQTIKNSKTLKNKYNYMNDMTSTISNILSTKLTAIREKNSSATSALRFEMDRMKAMKSQANEQDDNARIADMYSAFINTPVGVGAGGANVLGPNMQDMMLQGNPNANFDRASIGTEQGTWQGGGMTPAENRMILEAQGAIETVVMYDSESGNRWYEVVDKTTRQPVPNVEKPDPNTAYDLDLNIRGGFAKDANRGTVYPLILVNGGDKTITEY